MALTGTETLQVLGQDGAGHPAASTQQTTTGAIAALAAQNPNAPTAVGATKTASLGSTYLLNTAAGSVLTLPAATGSGGVVRAIVTTAITSNAHKILPNSVADFLQGIAEGHVAAGTPLSFSGNAAASHSIQMPFAGTTPSGGAAGDWFEFRDISAGLWEVTGAYLSGTTSTTPFSAATS